MDKDWFSFYVPVGCAKFKSHVQYKSESPIVAYQQHDQNSCCFSSLSSAFKSSNQLAAANEITTRISSLLTREILDIAIFANAIMTEKTEEKETNNYVINWNIGRKLALLVFLILSVSM